MSAPSALIQSYQLATVEPVTIYALADPRTSEVRYVGKAVDPERRLQQHLSRFQLSYYRSQKNSWLMSLLDAGHRPTLHVLEMVDSQEANAAEIRWIAKAIEMGARLTNGTVGGDGGAVTDPAAKARIRAAHLGAKRSDKTKQRMSVAARERCANEKERERLRSISNGTPPVFHGEKNPRTKLSDAQVRHLRELAAADEDLRSLAAEFGITPASVTQLVTGQSRRAAGGPIREAKPRSVLTDKDVAEIRRLAADGVRQVDLARRYGVHPSHVSDLVRGRRRSSSNKEG
jgi:DNA-binding transcriptional regulator YdaS (Cro superfamily)